MSNSVHSSVNLPSSAQTVPGGSSDVAWPPIMALFITAAFWLVISSAFALIASIKFHSPGFLADTEWLTYGRVRAAHINLLLYGFCIPGGMGVALWVLARSCGIPLVAPLSAVAGAAMFNVGTLVGMFAILAGDNTGFESLEFPLYAVVFVFLGYTLAAIPALLTLHGRTSRAMSVPQWYLIAAVFWFPWILSTAALLLLAMPVRGMAQPIIAWWYTANLQFVWLGLVGLAIAFYLLPRVVGRELNSRNMALFAFWILLLFGSLTGVPQTAPVPAWLPSLSLAAWGICSLFFIAVFMTARATTQGCCAQAWSGPARFISFGIAAFLVYGLVSILPIILGKADWLPFTWIHLARFELAAYAFFGSVVLGAIHFANEEYNGVPARKGNWVFMISSIGVALLVLPLIGAGILQALKLRNPDIAFVDVSRSTLHFLRLSTIGDTLILLAAFLVLWMLLSTICKTIRQRARAALAAAQSEVTR